MNLSKRLKKLTKQVNKLKVTTAKHSAELKRMLSYVAQSLNCTHERSLLYWGGRRNRSHCGLNGNMSSSRRRYQQFSQVGSNSRRAVAKETFELAAEL